MIVQVKLGPSLEYCLEVNDEGLTYKKLVGFLTSHISSVPEYWKPVVHQALQAVHILQGSERFPHINECLTGAFRCVTLPGTQRGESDTFCLEFSVLDIYKVED